MKILKLVGFLFTYLVFTTILFFILKFKYPLPVYKVGLISASLLILGGLIKRWLK